ncbi:hypothetical protein GCM10022381_17050 [Leifsonia kafniensis]|uniref:Uncharacterized protein n=1 Tax=Leifsonia kafniensis TaxID=475957 RepID=A0ABP7KEN5_9MICO
MRATPGFVASIALLTLLGWGQHTAPSASALPGASAATSQVCVFEATSKSPFVLPADVPAGCASLNQSASLQPEAMTPTALLALSSRQTATQAASHAPDPHLAGSGVSVIWLVPLGLGIIVLGVFFAVTMYLHRHDDID